jgi:protein-disulfide isomerase
MGRSSRRRRRGDSRERTSESSERARAGWRQTIDSFGGFLTLGSIGAAVLVVALLIAFNAPGSGSGANDAPYEPIVRSHVEGRMEGDPDAPVRIVVFEDFQCPFCGRFNRETEPLLRAEFVDTGIASVEYRHMAFLGAESVRAAEASECALEQGFFWEYHDIIFQKQPADGRENVGAYSSGNLKRFAREMADAWATLAPERAFDADEFDACIDSGRTRAEVELQTQQARAMGVTSTPSFLINGRLARGLLPIETFRQLIAEVQDGG